MVRSNDAAGFVIARVPAGRVSSLESAPVVNALQLGSDKIRTLDDGPERSSVASTPASVTEGIQELPYAPTGDIGAPQFIAQHPTFDGRGVTIAIVEGNPDPSAPGLRVTSTGKRKIAKVFDAGSEENFTTDSVVRPSGDQITVDGAAYALPSGRDDRSVRFGLLDEAALFGGFGADLNLDGDSTDRYGALVTGWSRPRLRLWVDTDQDQSFADEEPLADFNTTFPYSLTAFGRDDPATERVEEVMAFGASPCQVSGHVPFGPAQAERLGDRWEAIHGAQFHTTMGASTAVGQGMRAFGRSWDGIALGAQIISLSTRGDPTDFATRVTDLANALLTAAEQGADIITCSLWLPFDKPGEPAVIALADNLIDAYGISYTQIYGNGGTGTATPNGMVPSQGIAVGASITPRTYTANLGRAGIPSEGLVSYSSRDLPCSAAFLRNDPDHHPCRAAGRSTAPAAQGVPDHAEVALTGGNERLAGKTADWRKQWRNIHDSAQPSVAVELQVDGDGRLLTVRRQWTDKDIAESVPRADWDTGDQHDLAGVGAERCAAAVSAAPVL